MARKSVLSVSGWFFGFAVTILLIAVWGRSVVVDTGTLGESLAPLSESATVVDLFTRWLGDEMQQQGVDPVLIQPAVDHVVESPEFSQAMERFVVEVVVAASSAAPEGSSIDMGKLLTPVVPDVSAGLAAMGVPVQEPRVAEIVAGLDPLVIRGPGTDPMVGPESSAAARLGTAALIAVVTMVVAGWVYIVTSEDRITALRSLITRIAVGAFGFAILLRIGSWIVDPHGGRAPVPEALAALGRSKWLVPLQIALVAAAVAAGIYLGRRVLRRGEGSPTPSELPTSPPERELSLTKPS